MEQPVVLSYIQAEALLLAQQQGLTHVDISPDLGISMVTAKITHEGVTFPGGIQVNWQSLQKIKTATTSCFEVKEQTIEPIRVFSTHTNRACSLLPTRHTPSMLIAGFTMHRIVDIDPMQDTLKKIATIAPIKGRVLDTTTGLGYTAIEAAKTADRVITIELDPGAQEIARRNPWSRSLFHNPKIQQLMGDAYEVVPTFESESFDRILHDPPAFSLAGDLYSQTFYQQLYRILRRGGCLFHYIGDLKSKASGTVSRGALKRLQEVGFTRITRRPEAYGVVAYKR